VVTDTVIRSHAPQEKETHPLLASLQNHILYNRRLRRIILRARAGDLRREITLFLDIVAGGGLVFGVPLILIALFA
jgi:hypothetical protein